MPYRKTTIRRRSIIEEITPERMEYAFLGGASIDGDPFESAEIARAFWQKYRRLLLKWWFQGVPDALPEAFGFQRGYAERGPHAGARPCLWWTFDPDAPKGRRQLLHVVESVPIAGKIACWKHVKHVPTEAEIAEAWKQTAPGEEVDGLPQNICNGYPYVFESDEAFLRRHGLLTQAEEKALAAAVKQEAGSLKTPARAAW
jgi:hypothetical protein